MVIQINNLKEAEDFIKKKCEIRFQNIEFFDFTRFNEFIKEIQRGKTLEMPKNSKTYLFYTNFGEIYCNKLIVTEKYLLFFDNEKLIMRKERKKNDDIEYCYSATNGYYSGNPIVYNSELDKQFIDLSPIK